MWEKYRNEQLDHAAHFIFLSRTGLFVRTPFIEMTETPFKLT